MPSADQVPTNNSHSRMPWHMWVVLIAGSTGSALSCARPSSQPSHHASCPARSRLSRKRDGFFVSLARGHHGPNHPRDLVGERDSRNLSRPPGQQSRKPRPMFGAMDLGVADDRKARRPRTGRADSGHLACLYCRACSCLHWTCALVAPYRSRPRSCALIGTTLDQQRPRPKRWNQYRTDAGGCLEPHAHLVGSVPGPDQPVELQYLLLDALQLIPERRIHDTSHVRQVRLSFGSVTTLSSSSTP